MILSDEYLLKIKEAAHESLPVSLAKRDGLKKIVLQYRNMWADLPEHIRSNPKLIASLHTTRHDQFRGATAELISAWVLNKYFKEISYDVSVCGQTPDFYCSTDTHNYIFETTCLGPSEKERTNTKNFNALYKELNQQKSNIRLFIHGPPQPNNSGNFAGCLEKLKQQLAAIDETSDEKFHLEHEGASFSYSIFKTTETGPLMAGWMGEATENPNKALLLEKIYAKKEKYSFPFVLIGVTDTIFQADIHNVRSALLGDIQIAIDRKTLKGVGQNYTNTGYWGLYNTNLSSNLNLQGLIIIRRCIQGVGDDCHMTFQITLAENVQLKTGLKAIMHDIPDAFNNNNYLEITPPWN